jgi:hypothetical protein
MLPQIANQHALSELVSGYKPSLQYNSLLVHQASRKKMKAAKLNDNVLFTFLRDPIGTPHTACTGPENRLPMLLE